MEQTKCASTGPPWRSIRSVCFCKECSAEQRCMALMLLQTHKMTQKQFHNRLKTIYLASSIQGPQAVAWGLRMLAQGTPAGKDRRFFLNEADNAMDDAARMKKIRKGWIQFGEEDPWFVVHPGNEKQMARYNSNPLF